MLNWHKGQFSVEDLTQLVCLYLFYLLELAISFIVLYECRWQLFVISTDLKTDTDGRGHTEQLNTATTWLLFAAKEILYRGNGGRETVTVENEREGDRRKEKERERREKETENKRILLSVIMNQMPRMQSVLEAWRGDD